MKCPQCSATLSTINYEGIQIETCSSCGGEWLDAGELGHIVKVREQRFSEEERRAVAEATPITGLIIDNHDRDLQCPKCGGTTDAINYGGDTGIVIDKCPNCRGIWLDAGEMEKIQSLVEGWEDGLPEMLKKYGPRLRRIEAEVQEKTRFNASRFGFVNAIINGILDWTD